LLKRARRRVSQIDGDGDIREWAVAKRTDDGVGAHH
jgi:hypothetical protein